MEKEKIIGERLKNYRGLLGLSIEDLAQMLNVNPYIVEKFEGREHTTLRTDWQWRNIAYFYQVMSAESTRSRLKSLFDQRDAPLEAKLKAGEGLIPMLGIMFNTHGFSDKQQLSDLVGEIILPEYNFKQPV